MTDSKASATVVPGADMRNTRLVEIGDARLLHSERNGHNQVVRAA